MSISKFVGFSSVMVSAALLSACTSAPTYGTGTRSDVQLLEDVSNLATLTPKEQAKIDYKPRAGIVKPATVGTLPPPQTAFADTEQWPESPEQRRERLRAEATANQDNPLYRPNIISTGRGAVIEDNAGLTPQEQQKLFREQLATKNGSYQGRRYLSDPPAEYKAPLETAPADELGEDEKVKERRRLAAAKKKGSFKLGDLWPF